jgi:hypothetical protein
VTPQAVDLSPEEYHAFAEGIASLARQKEKRPSDFDTFRAWLDRNGPYGCLIDGANVALFGQNWEAGGFSFAQISSVLDGLHEERPDLKPLLVSRASTPTQYCHTAFSWLAIMVSVADVFLESSKNYSIE